MNANYKNMNNTKEVNNMNININKSIVTYLEPLTAEVFEITLPDQYLANTLYECMLDNEDLILAYGVERIVVEHDSAEFYPDENQWEPGSIFIAINLFGGTVLTWYGMDTRAAYLQSSYARLYCDNQCVAYDRASTIHSYYQAAPNLNLSIAHATFTTDYLCFIDSAFEQAIIANLTAMDTDYEEMLEAMRKSDYEELAESDLPF